MGQSDRGVHNDNTDGRFDLLIPTSLAHHGMSKWCQLMAAMNSSFHQFTGNITGKRVWKSR
jgi:hypothetical protein